MQEACSGWVLSRLGVSIGATPFRRGEDSPSRYGLSLSEAPALHHVEFTGLGSATTSATNVAAASWEIRSISGAFLADGVGSRKEVLNFRAFSPVPQCSSREAMQAIYDGASRQDPIQPVLEAQLKDTLTRC